MSASKTLYIYCDGEVKVEDLTDESIQGAIDHAEQRVLDLDANQAMINVDGFDHGLLFFPGDRVQYGWDICSTSDESWGETIEGRYAGQKATHAWKEAK